MYKLLIFSLIGMCYSMPSNVKVTSRDFKTVVRWNNDKEYNVSVGVYGFGWGDVVCTNAKNKCDISKEILSTSVYSDFKVKFTTMSGLSFVKDFKTICSIIKFSPPRMDLIRDGTHITVLIHQPVVHGTSIPIYDDSNLCNIMFDYNLNITFGSGKSKTVNIEDYNCNEQLCKYRFSTTDKICVSTIGENNFLGHIMTTEISETKCIDESLDIKQCILYDYKDFNSLSEYINRYFSKNFYNNKHIKVILDSIVKSFKSLVSLIE
ncbi:soluble interferon-gamma receptor [Cotia virus SPAn232]|uniref:Soluble interferon-gamma receptor n=2 Tax=Cotia virus TaxID=39444 RepID=H6TAH0_9POXV|nr:soluble interferon-gamma receptor [Cotia virus SPAn232]AFB76907.1 soluble interferon-gamma receptor [Cotia virus SPAn232]AIT70632.1 soluble interferon-gamma receptor [Cotia virus]